MSCDKYSERLALHAIDELSPSYKAKLESHLESCQECRAELAQLRAIVKTLSDDPNQALSEVEKLGIEREVFRQMSQQTRRRLSGSQRLVRSMVQVAAAMMIFVAGYGVKSIINGDSGRTPDIIDKIEMRSDYSRMHASSMRFSTEGLKLITKGKKALEETSLRAIDTD